MKKKEISYDELVVGLILKFGNIDVDDILVSMDMIGIDNFSSVNESGLGKYIGRNAGNRFEFNMKMVKRNYECVDDFYLVVQDFNSNNVKKYLDNLDLFEFVLRKIKRLKCVNLDSCDHNFSDIQMFVVSELKRLGYLMDGSHKSFVSDSYDDMKLSKRGNLYLFLIDNKERIDKFTKKLRDGGYNDMLLQAFLIAQDLDRDIIYIEENIFTIDCFFEFCSAYDINPNVIDTKMNIENNGYSRRKRLDNK